MSSINEGGETPVVFPCSLRDYFAATAMQSLLARGWVNDDSTSPPMPYCEAISNDELESDNGIGCLTLSRDAYAIADAMLAARTTTKGGE